MYARYVFVCLQVCWESRGLYVYITQPGGQFLLAQASMPYALMDLKDPARS